MSDEQQPDDRDNTNSALLQQVRRRADSAQRWLREGDPSLARQFAAVGVLGWIIVIPALLGVWLGRSLDNWLATEVTFTAALLLLGLLVGGWSAWRWMHEP